MNFYINCNADDKELIEAVNNTFEDVETINSHNFGDITEIIVICIPIAALTIQTIDFILTHFANRDTKKNRTLRIGPEMKEYEFKGFSRAEIIAILESLSDDN